MKHNKIDRSHFQGIEDKFKKYKSINFLSNYYKVDAATIKKVLLELNIDPLFYKKIKDKKFQDTLEKAIAFYCEGNSVCKTIKNFKISAETLTSHLTKHNLMRNNAPIHVTCMICGQSFNNSLLFSKHISTKHKIKPKTYYDQYTKKENDGFCLICKKETPYINLIEGYRKCCSHSCGAKLFKQNLKKDPIKFKEYRKKFSDIKQKWHNETSTHIKTLMHEKIGQKIKNKNKFLSVDEKRKKYGWLNKLNEDDRKKFIENVLLQTGFHLWWKDASKEEKIKVFKKRAETQKFKLSRDIVNSFKMYRDEINLLTEKTYKKYKNDINPQHLKRGLKKYHLDHKYSVLEGFLNKIPCEIISSKHNLEIISYKENLSKNKKCSITKEELLEKYNHDPSQKKHEI